MTEIDKNHKKLIDTVRGLSTSEDHKLIGEKLDEYTDEEIIQMFFKNDRLGSLSHFGLKILSSCFAHWNIEFTKSLTTKQHILLMRESKLPYFLDGKRFVTFESDLGVMLALAGGNNSYIEQMFEF